MYLISQGDGTGSFGASLETQFATSQALAHYPNEDVNIRKIMDDYHITGPARVLGPLYITLSAILFDCLGLTVNLRKSSLILLQAFSVAHPPPPMALHYTSFFSSVLI